MCSERDFKFGNFGFSRFHGMDLTNEYEYTIPALCYCPQESPTVGKMGKNKNRPVISLMMFGH